jgi:hypothetical protein
MKQEPNKQINEIDYLSGEFTDEFLHAQADAGDYLLDEDKIAWPADSISSQRTRISI